MKAADCSDGKEPAIAAQREIQHLDLMLSTTMTLAQARQLVAIQRPVDVDCRLVA
jgi:hypothetical protein